MFRAIIPRLNELHLRDIETELARGRLVAGARPARSAAAVRASATRRARSVLASARCAIGSLAVAFGLGANEVTSGSRKERRWTRPVSIRSP